MHKYFRLRRNRFQILQEFSRNFAYVNQEYGATKLLCNLSHGIMIIIFSYEKNYSLCNKNEF
jgi:hypothetical protein